MVRLHSMADGIELPDGHIALRFPGHTYAYLQALAVRDTLSAALNGELLALRTWGLSTPQQRAMAAEAQRQGLTVWRHYRLLIFRYARGLPPAQRPAPPLSEELPPVRTSFDIEPSNHRWLLRLIAEERLAGPNEGMTYVLDFARRYDLPAGLLAALEEEARRQDTTARALLREEMWRRARELVGSRRHK